MCHRCLFGEMPGQLDPARGNCSSHVLFDYMYYFRFRLGLAILSVCFPMVERTHDLYVSSISIYLFEQLLLYVDSMTCQLE